MKSSKYNKVKLHVHKNEHIKGKHGFIKDQNKDIKDKISPSILHSKGELMNVYFFMIELMININI